MSLDKLLSKTLGQIKKGYAYDSPLGGIPLNQVIAAPIAASAVAVLAAYTLDEFEPIEVPNGITQVADLTIAATWAIDDTIEVKVGRYSLTYVATSTDVTVIAAGLKAALEADNNISREVTPTVLAGVITLTGTKVGKIGIATVVNTVGNGTGVVAVTSIVPASPDVFRTVVVQGNAGGMVGNVIVIGRDFAGRTVKDAIALNGSTLVEGNVAFSVVDNIILPIRTNPADTVTVGISDKLGLTRPIKAISDVKLLKQDGVVDIVAAVDAINNTIEPTTVPDGSVVYEVSYEAYAI